MMENKFNVRVYGLLFNERSEVLVSDEFERGLEFTKFPGGGLEYGEGPIECVQREFMEECGVEVDVINHFYTTDFFQESVFDDSQLISIYYVVKAVSSFPLYTATVPFDFPKGQDPAQSFRWLSLAKIKPEDMTFPVDKQVALMLATRNRSFSN